MAREASVGLTTRILSSQERVLVIAALAGLLVSGSQSRLIEKLVRRYKISGEESRRAARHAVLCIIQVGGWPCAPDQEDPRITGIIEQGGVTVAEVEEMAIQVLRGTVEDDELWQDEVFEDFMNRRFGKIKMPKAWVITPGQRDQAWEVYAYDSLRGVVRVLLARLRPDAVPFGNLGSIDALVPDNAIETEDFRHDVHELVLRDTSDPKRKRNSYTEELRKFVGLQR